jgi:hypothetical protein
MADTTQRFLQSSNTRLADQIKTLMGNIDYLCLADKHSKIETHKFLTDPSVMKALAESGVKTIRLEAIDLDEELVLRAAVQGKIPMPAAATYLDVTAPTDVVGGKSRMAPHEYAIGLLTPTIVKLAHENGIIVKAVDRGEGFLPKEYVPQVESIQRRYAAFIISELGNKPDLSGINIREFFNEAGAKFNRIYPNTNKELEGIYNAMHKASAPLSEQLKSKISERLGFWDVNKATPQQLLSARKAVADDLSNAPEPGRSVALNMIRETKNLDDKAALQKLLPAFAELHMLGLMMERRMGEDVHAVNRIRSDRAAGGKEVVVYGSAHFERLAGDVDHGLGDHRSAVLRVSSNTSVDNRENEAYKDSIERFMNIKLDEPYNYTLDLSNGAWTNTRTNQTIRLEIPEGLKPVAQGDAIATPAPNRAATPIL